MAITHSPSKIKVLQVVADGNPGGGTTFVIALIRHLLKKSDFDVYAITNENSYGYKSMHDMDCKVFGVDFFKSRLSFTLPFALNALVNTIKPDVVHVHGGRAAFQLLLYKLLHPQIIFVYTVHGYHFVHKSFLGRVIGRLSEMIIAAVTDYIVFVSNGDKHIAQTQNIINATSRSITIYNGIESTDLQYSSKQFDVVFVGRMVRQKNPALAVDVFKLLTARGYRCAMIGGGELENDVKQKMLDAGIQNKVAFFGVKTHKETLEIMQQSKIMLLPSLWEGLPITLLEAMQFGLPAVVSDVTGNNEAIIDGINGFVVSGNQAGAYADKINTLLTDAALYDKQSIAAQKLFQEKYQLETCIAQYARVYQNAAMNNGNHAQ